MNLRDVNGFRGDEEALEATIEASLNPSVQGDKSVYRQICATTDQNDRKLRYLLQMSFPATRIKGQSIPRLPRPRPPPSSDDRETRRRQDEEFLQAEALARATADSPPESPIDLTPPVQSLGPEPASGLRLSIKGTSGAICRNFAPETTTAALYAWVAGYFHLNPGEFQLHVRQPFSVLTREGTLASNNVSTQTQIAVVPV
jgi:hypothetical protein